MKKRTGSKGRRVVAAACAVAMALAVAVTPAHAAPARRAAPIVAGREISPKGALVEVPDYYYILYYKDGGQYRSPTYYKYLNVPAGSRVVEAGVTWHNEDPGDSSVSSKEVYVYDYRFVRA